jgi:hypothetical protein
MAVRAQCDRVFQGIFAASAQLLSVVDFKERGSVGAPKEWCRLSAILTKSIGAPKSSFDHIWIAAETNRDDLDPLREPAGIGEARVQLGRCQCSGPRHARRQFLFEVIALVNWQPKSFVVDLTPSARSSSWFQWLAITCLPQVACRTRILQPPKIPDGQQIDRACHLLALEQLKLSQLKGRNVLFDLASPSAGQALFVLPSDDLRRERHS